MKRPHWQLLSGAAAALLAVLATLLLGPRWLVSQAPGIGLPVAIQTPAGPGARLPRLAALPGGGAVLSWVQPRPGGGHVLRVARYEAGRFGPPQDVAHGADWFVNWSDFPSVTPVDDQFWVAHWLAMLPGGSDVYHYGIAMAISRDGGASWRRVGSPHADQTLAEHGFLAVAPEAGRAMLVWLDGRLNDSRTTFTLRTTYLDRDGVFAPDVVLDPDVCSCCWPALARSAGGLWAAYRGRTQDEVRDFQLRRHTAGRWSAALPLGGEGWQIAGCPVNGVALAARGAEVVAAWFSGAQGRPRVRAAFMHDAAPTPQPAPDVDSDGPVGRVAVAWAGPRQALVLHIAAPGKDGRADLRLTTITAAGVGAHRVVDRVSGGRDSGLPQLLEVADGWLLAWTEAAPQYGLRVRRVARDG